MAFPAVVDAIIISYICDDIRVLDYPDESRAAFEYIYKCELYKEWNTLFLKFGDITVTFNDEAIRISRPHLAYQFQRGTKNIMIYENQNGCFDNHMTYDGKWIIKSNGCLIPFEVPVEKYCALDIQIDPTGEFGFDRLLPGKSDWPKFHNAMRMFVWPARNRHMTVSSFIEPFQK